MERTFYGVTPRIRRSAMEEEQDNQWEEAYYISEDELEDAIAAMKLGKAPGQYEITPEMIRNI